MKVVVHLPDEALAAIEARQDWVGQAQVAIQPAGGPFAPDAIHISFPGVKRRHIASAEALASAAKAAEVLSPTERLIVEAWNDSEYIREYAIGEPRNNPVPPREIPALRPLLRRAIASPGPEQLLTWMGQYFDCCLRRGHLWDDRNHGYSHLGGFLRAAIHYAKDKHRVPYWMKVKDDRPVADKHAALTAQLANAYAARFLGRDQFGLRNPSDEYARFMSASTRLAKLAEANDWPHDRAVRVLLDAVAESWGLGGAPPPGALGSDRTWQVIVPAYLKARYG